MVTGALVGRDAEIAALLGLLDGGPRLRVAVVTGEPGIGKTRLLQEFRRRAQSRDVEVLAARAIEVEREQPFALMR